MSIVIDFDLEDITRMGDEIERLNAEIRQCRNALERIADRCESLEECQWVAINACAEGQNDE